MIIAIPLRKANPISRLTTRNNNLLNPQLARGLNHIISTQHIPFKTLIIGHEHVPRIRCEMYNGIDWAHGHRFRVSRIRVVINVEIRSEGVEYLAGVRKVCLEGVYCGVREGGEVEVKYGVTFGEEVGYYVAACLP